METLPNSPAPMDPALREAVTQQLRVVFDQKRDTFSPDIAAKINNHLMAADEREEDLTADAEYRAAAALLLSTKAVTQDELDILVEGCKETI